MTPLAEAHGATVYHADWRALLDVVPACDALITDTPYSEKTHGGHEKGAATANRAKGWAERTPDAADQGARRYALRGHGDRRKINYAAWTPDDVRAFVAAWSPKVTGWFVSITDHVLAPAWADALEAAGRYVFAPLPYIAPGSRVRMVGDGPPCWTNQIIVARPRTAPWNRWATSEARSERGARPLPGYYLLPEGFAEDMTVVGGKPLWLLERLVEDYTRPGARVVDPCCGAGTTLRAAQGLGRMAIGGDIDEHHARIAAARIAKPVQVCGLIAPRGPAPVQTSLLVDPEPRP